LRYADAVINPRQDLVFCVREDHTRPGEATNALVSVDLKNDNAGKVLVSGNDFYSSPRLSPDGARLAWLTWNHPNMPWDGTELWVGEVAAGGAVGPSERLAGGVGESIFQPEWSPDGVLHFVSDRSGWWNLERWRNGRAEPLCRREAEFGLPQWGFGMATYGFVAPDRIVCTYADGGTWHLANLDTTSGQLTPIETPYTSFGGLRAAGGRVAFTA